MTGTAGGRRLVEMSDRLLVEMSAHRLVEMSGTHLVATTVTVTRRAVMNAATTATVATATSRFLIRLVLAETLGPRG